MPRGPRLDAPGTLHHVIFRGIERSDIVYNDKDRDDFRTRMGDLALSTATSIFAWALMNNHAHILLRSGPEGLPVFMRRFLTGYAVSFNRRHQRCGHLFQNRYKSIICEENAYFTELVRYIHLNPLRAGIVASMAELDSHPWCGHSCVMGNNQTPWQDAGYVLRCFGKRKNEARNAYRDFVEKGIAQGSRPELAGGGLIRSMGGWSVVKALRSSGSFERSDERILGSGDFVEAVLAATEQKFKRQLPLRERIDRARQRVLAVCRNEGMKEILLTSGSRRRSVSAVRSRLAFELTEDFGLSLAETAGQLGVSISAIRKIIERRGDVVD